MRRSTDRTHCTANHSTDDGLGFEMQATERGKGAASGASVQRDPDGADGVDGADARVVICCDRCTAEAPPSAETDVHWSVLLVGAAGSERTKQLAFCRECTRAFRLFLLTPSTEERWNRIVDEVTL